MTDAQFIPVGRVVKAHGLKGEVSVASTGDLPFVLQQGLRVWFVPPPLGVRSSEVTGVRQGPKGPLVTFADVIDIDTAAALRGSTIMVRPGDIPDELLEEHFDPVDFSVIDETHGSLGVVTEVLVTGANDVLVVKGPKYGEVLIPVIDDCILEIDEDRTTIHVRLLPGLLELGPS